MSDERKCWLCGRNGYDDPLESHHVYNGALKKKSEKCGALADLCGKRCHREGEEAVHKNIENRRRLQAEHQERIMHEQGWTVADFIREFGRNYI